MDMSATGFDAEELKHLALKAMRTDREEDALRLIKAALALEPDNNELLYLLATLHSNLGMVDRAIIELTRVLDVAPELINGRFQLGLLHFTKRQFDQAAAVWAPLIQALDSNDALRVFAEGLTLIGNDKLAEGAPILERGIGLSNNLALNEDMARIVTESRRYLASSGGANPSQQSADARRGAKATQHVLLSGYGKPLHS